MIGIQENWNFLISSLLLEVYLIITPALITNINKKVFFYLMKRNTLLVVD